MFGDEGWGGEDCEVSSSRGEGWRVLMCDRTRLYDELRGKRGWPAQYDGRAIKNVTSREGGGEGAVERYEQAVREEDWTRLTTFAGTGVGLVHKIEPAGVVLERIREEAKDVLRKMAEKWGDAV